MGRVNPNPNVRGLDWFRSLLPDGEKCKAMPMAQRLNRHESIRATPVDVRPYETGNRHDTPGAI